MRETLLLIFVVIAMQVTGCATIHTKGKPTINRTDATGFINRPVTVDKSVMTYSLFIPKDYDPKKPWPLTVFFHGAGKRGSDGLFQTEVGIGRTIRRHADWFPCLVAMPQCPLKEKVFWDKSESIIDAALADARTNYSVARNGFI